MVGAFALFHSLLFLESSFVISPGALFNGVRDVLIFEGIAEGERANVLILVELLVVHEHVIILRWEDGYIFVCILFDFFGFMVEGDEVVIFFFFNFFSLDVLLFFLVLLPHHLIEFLAVHGLHLNFFPVVEVISRKTDTNEHRTCTGTSPCRGNLAFRL